MGETITPDDLEGIWDRLLSRQAAVVRTTFISLSEDERRAVLEHLQRMATEPGWQAEQCISAQAALDILRVLPR
jgi:hypothetical protein